MKYNHSFSSRLRDCLIGILIGLLVSSAVACGRAPTITETTSPEVDPTLPVSADPSSASATTPTPSESLPAATTTVPTELTEPTTPAVTTTAPTVTTTAPPATDPPVTEPPTPDVTPPVVTGKDFEVVQGESVSYRKKISVSDDRDKSPTISVDNSKVDLDTPGVYPVVYTVTDDAGNAATLTLQMTVLKKIEAAPTEEYVLSEAQKILDDITDGSMSDLQVAYSIYRWTKYNIGYSSTSDKTSWLVGAYDGFRKRQGDCYTYFAVSKALLTAAGIDNVDVIKHRTSDKQSMHYWSLVNVGDGWYHFDSTPYIYKESNFFMVTDEELVAWDSKYYKNGHGFLEEGLPERATDSIQDRINYGSSKLKY